MLFVDATQAEVVEAVLRFYRQRLNLPEQLVYPTIEPLNPPQLPSGGDFWISVAPGGGTFPFEEQDDEQLREELELVVTAYSRMSLDRTSREQAFLFDPRRGAFWLKSRLLLIVGQELTDAEGQGLIASRVVAHSATKPTYDPQQGIGWVGVVLGVEFDWALAGAEDLGDD